MESEALCKISLMTWNIWRGGDQVHFGSVIETIQKSGADIVCLQETEGNIEKIASSLGWSHCSTRLQIISKFPIYCPRRSRQGKKVVREGEFSVPYLFVEVAPQKFIAVSNIHLPSTLDGPESLRDGKSHKDVDETESRMRASCLKPIVKTLNELNQVTGLPVFCLGDFNSPSHLDCPGACAVKWPSTVIMERVGFVDSFRHKFSDVTQHPGLTWSAGYPYPRLKQDENHNRIDFIFFKANDCQVSDSYIIGEGGIHKHGRRHINKGVRLSVHPWPSDHRAVVSEFILSPQPLPIPMISIDKSTFVHNSGISSLQVRIARAGRDDLRIVLRRRGISSKSLLSCDVEDGADRTNFVLDIQAYPPGEYVVDLRSNQDVSDSREFKILGMASSIPTLHVDRLSRTKVKVIWNNGPQHKWDWVGLYRSHETNVNSYEEYVYVDACTEGYVIWDVAHLELGQYEFRFFKDDSYQLLAWASFDITDHSR